MSSGGAPAAPSGAGPLDRVERFLHKGDVVTCLVAGGLLVFTLVGWVLLRGLAHGNTAPGTLLRVLLGAGLAASLVRWVPKRLRRPAAWALALAGGAVGAATREVGVAWLANVQGWLQDGSNFALLGGPRGIATRLTLLLVLAGASLATASGRHVSIDLVTRALGPWGKRLLSPLGGIVAALVCLASSWGFFDHLSIDVFGAARRDTVVDKVAHVGEGLSRHFFLYRSQVGLDIKLLPRVAAGQPWDRALTGPEWNEVVSRPAWAEVLGPDAAKTLQDPDPTSLRSPLVSVPGEASRGLLMRDLGLVIPFGLFLIGLRFLLWVLRRCPREEETAGPAYTRRNALLALGAIAGVGLLALAGGGAVAGALAFGALLGVPLFAVMAGSTALAWTLQSEPINRLAPKVLEEAFAGSPVLVTIPLFTILGFVLARSRAPDRIITAARANLGWLPGGLGLVCLGASAFFTTLTGASGVTIVAIGGLLLPALEKQGYPKDHALGLVTAGGSLGLLFPPSLPILVYALVSGLDFGLAFQAAFLPGVLVFAALSAFTIFTAWRAGAQREAFHFKEAAASLAALGWDAGIPFILLVGVLSGLTGLDESAAVALAWAAWVALRRHKDLDRKQVAPIFAEATALAGAVVLILMMANALMNWVIDRQFPAHVLEGLLAVGLSERWQLLIVLNLFLLVVGMVMDGFSAILVTVPLVMPLAARFGFDPFHLAVMFLLNLELAFLMPPMGLNLFISAFRFNRPLSDVYRASVPFILVLAGTLGLVMLVPSLSNVAVRPAIAAAREKAKALGVPPTEAWMLECAQEDVTHPHPCTEEEKKAFAPTETAEDEDDLLKAMLGGGESGGDAEADAGTAAPPSPDPGDARDAGSAP